MLKLTIDNQRLVPVRLVPFITGWIIAPDELARILANRDGFSHIHIPSFHMSESGRYHSILSKEWDVILVDLESLTDTLKAKESVDNENYPLWREESVKVLPAGTFVWLDDLEAAWHAAYSKEQMTLPHERPGDRDLNLHPRIPTNLRQQIYEGFESLVPARKQAPDSPVGQESSEHNQPSVTRREARKLATQDMYESWRKGYRKLQRKHPNMSDVWYSREIAKMDIGQGRNYSTIKKNMKKPG